MSPTGCRPAAVLAAIVATLLALTGCASVGTAVASGAEAGRASPSAAPAAADAITRTVRAPSAGPARRAAAPVTRYRSVRSHDATPRPVAVTLPTIGVSSRLVRLGRDTDGTIQVPRDWQRAGWYRHGPRPGQAGPAVILGHVDSRSGPAVFFRLHELRPGDAVHVERADGSVVTFVVDRVERHAKTRFPTNAVYLPTLRPALRLVTCGGAFDTAAGHYRDNVVVFATFAD